MEKLFKISSILFYILSFVVFVILGAFFAGVTGAAEDQGLAGGAIVLGYGIISGFFAIVAAIVIVFYTYQTVIIKINRILFLLLLILIAVLSIRVLIKKKAVSEDNQAEISSDLIHQTVINMETTILLMHRPGCNPTI